MFNPDFYPTPEALALRMIEGYNLKDKVVLEPSAGKGDLATILKNVGANVIVCENDPDLSLIAMEKFTFINFDFLKVKSEDISHIDYIIMNPPFSKGAEHLDHAFEIAPAGTHIICLLNAATIENAYSQLRKTLLSKIEAFGTYEIIENAFAQAQRQTDVKTAIVRMYKPGEDNSKEYEGFFMEDDAPEANVNGIMSYNFVREVVNRYKNSLMIYDKQLNISADLHEAMGSVFKFESRDYSRFLSINREDLLKERAMFKKDLQKAAWQYIIKESKLEKYSTKALREDLNKFIEQQTKIPFTMKNIYRMLEIIIGTSESRMNKAILAVFEWLTKHTKENRYNVPGWATNSHYLINKKFIIDGCFEMSWKRGMNFRRWDWNGERLTDMEKALCFLTGKNYDDVSTMGSINPSGLNTNTWTDGGEFFTFKCFKKGTGHFIFKDEKVWEMLNRKVAEILGYPLPESRAGNESQNKTGATKNQPNATPRGLLLLNNNPDFQRLK